MRAESVRNELHELRSAIRELHKSLLDAERLVYEKAFGRIASDFYLLQIAAEDPQFAWLRALSSEMIRLDELIARGDDILDADVRLFGARMRALLLPDEPMTVFQSRYQSSMQEQPSVIMAHAAVMRALPPAMPVPFFVGGPDGEESLDGDVRIAMHRPGSIVPGHGDKGYGPLGVLREVTIPHGGGLPAHEYRNEDIVWWSPEGNVQLGAPVNANLPLVINAGRGYPVAALFGTGESATRMVQVFVRPRSVDVEPHVQTVAVPGIGPGSWRTLVGPEEEDAPFFVRNAVEVRDGRFASGHAGTLPQREGWHRYLFVHSGSIVLDGARVRASESVVIPSDASLDFVSEEDAILLVVLVDVAPSVTRAGTIAR